MSNTSSNRMSPDLRATHIRWLSIMLEYYSGEETSLRTRLDNREVWGDGHENEWRRYQAEAAALRAAIAALSGDSSAPETSPDDARDAARYRRLRRGNDYKHAGPMVVLCEQEHIESDERPFWILSEGALDAAVDAARGSSETTPRLSELIQRENSDYVEDLERRIVYLAKGGGVIIGLLEDAMERMTRARMILTDNNPRPECNWAMLDASDLRKRLLEGPSVQETTDRRCTHYWSGRRCVKQDGHDDDCDFPAEPPQKASAQCTCPPYNMPFQRAHYPECPAEIAPVDDVCRECGVELISDTCDKCGAENGRAEP